MPYKRDTGPAYFIQTKKFKAVNNNNRSIYENCFKQQNLGMLLL